MSESFKPVRIGQFQGYAQCDFDFQQYWDSITEHLAYGVPCYCRKEWRKVYRISLTPSSVIYVKDVDESRDEKSNFWRSMFSTEAFRYYHNHRRLVQVGVTTPPLLFALGERKGPFWVRSLTATSELVGYLPWSRFFAARSTEPHFDHLKDDALKETAGLAATFHRLGYYFSLGGSNVFVREDYQRGSDNMALIDLDHIRRAVFGRIPGRRRMRNLHRFRVAVDATVGLSTSDYESFLRYYEEFFP